MRFFWIAVVIALFFGCSADYDEFGESPYHKLDEIHFAEEAGGIQVFADEHKVVITLEERSDSLAAWDSVTIESIDISHMASLHLVESKILEFPTDSAAFDSLARQVAYVEKKLKKGSRIRLPASRVIYVVVIAENGDMTIWKIQFEIPGEESQTDSTEENGEGKSEDKKEEASKSSDNSISLEFKDAVDTKASGDTIYVTYPQGFDIKTATLSNVSVPGGAKVSPDPKSVKDWSTPQKFKVTAEDGSEKNWVVVVSSIKNNATDLQLLFKDQFKVNRSQDTIYIKLKNGSSVGAAAIDSWSVSEGAAVDPKPDAVKVWTDYQSFKVTAEDGSVKTWVLSLSVAAADEKVSSDKELVSISAAGEESAASIEKSKNFVELHLAADADPSAVKVTLKVSETASHNLPETVDLRSPVTFTITAEDASSETWTLSASVPSVPPRILSMKIAGKTAKIDSTQDNGGLTYNVHYDDLTFLADLTKLAVSDIELTKGASISGVTDGGSYDLGRGVKVVVSNGSESVEYEIRAGYQYPGSDFNHWVADDFGNKNDIEGWDNGNNSALDVTKTLTVNENEQIIKMKSQDAKILGIGRFASGNMLVAYFNPKKVSTTGMTKYDDGNELIDFGRPFYGRPRYVEFDVKYEGKGDSCDLYVLLENRSRTSNEGKNQYRTSSDKNTLVASAWYRATTVTSTDDPDVVSIKDASRSGYKTIRLAFKYGEPDSWSPIYNSSVFTKALKNSAGIDNHLDKTSSPDSFDVTHIRVVMASSAMGNLYKGTVGATLWADEMRLIY